MSAPPASAIFFVGYVLFQIAYPSLAWFRPGSNLFSWAMFSGVSGRPAVTVIFADGSERTVEEPMRATSSARVLSASVNLWRFLPPHLCARRDGAREIHAVDARSGRREVTKCPSAAR